MKRLALAAATILLSGGADAASSNTHAPSDTTIFTVQLLR